MNTEPEETPDFENLLDICRMRGWKVHTAAHGKMHVRWNVRLSALQKEIRQTDEVAYIWIHEDCGDFLPEWARWLLRVIQEVSGAEHEEKTT